MLESMPRHACRSYKQTHIRTARQHHSMLLSPAFVHRTFMPAALGTRQLAALTAGSSQATYLQALGCIIYISEGRNQALLQQLEREAKDACRRGAVLASLFVDAPYNRSNFCLVGTSVEWLSAAATQLSQAALQLVDLRQHEALHPRLGVVDHISCHPLGSLTSPAHAGSSERDGVSLQQAACLAQTIGRQLGSGKDALPVFLYGAAHPQRQSLADIRRALGYFSGATQGHWSGSGAAQLPLQPAFGPPVAPSRFGVCCIGASPWIVNFNVLLDGVTELAAARRIARAVSERGGGLPSVQAMALYHEKGVEIACNILDRQAAPPELVEERVRQLAAAEGGGVKSSYMIGRSPEDLLALLQPL